MTFFRLFFFFIFFISNIYANEVFVTNKNLYILHWNTLQKRLGELRDNNGFINDGYWGRVYGGRGSEGKLRVRYYDIQFGWDKHGINNFGDFYTGYIVDLGFAKKNNNINPKTTGFGGGIYFTNINNEGLYFDALAKLIFHRNTFNHIIFMHTSNARFGGILSAELGYRYGNEFYIEPQTELILSYIPAYKFESESLVYKDESIVNLANKTALNFGYVLNDNTTLRLGIGGMFDLYNTTFLNFLSGLFLGESKDNIPHFHRDSKMFVNLSSNIKVNDQLKFSIEFEKTYFGSFNIDFNVNLNFRYIF